MQLAVAQRRDKLAENIKKLAETTDCAGLKEACDEWLANKDDAEGSKAASEKLLSAIGSCECGLCDEILENK